MADEILWRAAIDPHRPPADLNPGEIRNLARQTKQVARDAMRVIGTDWGRPPDSWLFNHRWRSGGTCPKTKQPLIYETIAGRTTCYAPFQINQFPPTNIK